MVRVQFKSVVVVHVYCRRAVLVGSYVHARVRLRVRRARLWLSGFFATTNEWN